jgi:predicted SAM-dependent methyltransferase
MVRKLHIGGKVASLGWEIIDVIPGPHVDHVGDAKDLSRFPDCSFDVIYASHVLEHFDYKDELGSVLREWYRVLKMLGRLYISVPDIDALAKLLLAKDRLTKSDRFYVMRMIFGGHIDTHDYHFVGLNDEFLRDFLTAAGFSAIKKVDIFEIFQDTSCRKFDNELISLNLVAKKLLDR